jgi:mRNA-degrading endonuclease RelE of RelBE toxin-antitoxin system
MNFEIITTPYFEREAKKLLKKYPSIKDDLAALGEELSKNPTLGTPLGNQIFKIRLSITSKGKGKSGGIANVYQSRSRIQIFKILADCLKRQGAWGPFSLCL